MLKGENTLTYKNYIARYEIDVDTKLIVGNVEGLNDTIMFEAENGNELQKVFEECVCEYIEMCRKDGVAHEEQFLERL